MKVIIDIPDDVIAEKSYCKYFGCLSTKLLEIIENSIPVNTDGDTISRSALKETFENSPYYMYGEESIIKIIDNAPTVKPCDNCDLYFKAMTKEEMKKGGAE